MKKIIALILLLSLTVVILAGCSNDNEISKIRDRGILRVGVKMDVPNFGYYNQKTGEFEGLEVDLARLIAKELLGNENAIEFIGVATQTKRPMLENGELDLIVATYTITDERKEFFNFSQPYYTNEIGFLVLKDSSLDTMADMDGKTIGIMQQTTSKDALLAEAAELGVEIKLEKFSSYPEIKAALLAGSVDAFSADKSIMVGYSDENTRILDEGFDPQYYGIATRLDETALASFIDNFLTTIKDDGRYDEILSRWSS